MLILNIANKNYSSWSLRPWVLMKELNIPFEEHLHPFGNNNNWDNFRTFSPTGLVPCLQDGDAAVWDSLAIAEYLAEQYPSVWPEEKLARAWARSAAAEMHSGFSTLRDQCNMTVGQRVRLTKVSPALIKDIKRIDELWMQGLSQFGGQFLAGDRFTAVDAFYAPVAYRIRTYALELSEASMAYAERLLGLPSLLEWEKAALAETWRDPFHEEETLRSGEVTADYRTS